MITIINYGCGNIKAIQNVYHKLSIQTKIANRHEDLLDATKLILPGVGAFDFAMQKFIHSGMKEKTNELVVKKKVPVLGICVGVQLMTLSSEEGVLPGLGWINAAVKKFENRKVSYPINLPHMGWNDVNPVKESSLFKGLEKDARFYFLHSYYLSSNTVNEIIAESDYAGAFTCAVNHENVYGVQFHPEKSHRYGVTLLNNFAKLI
ncbi:MAG: imidazole glycerol phosphate synthase subunit HisH [Bacteroidales bacterium]|nr:imidazole glycerol phosphate synthase subunit HisH [Bacteroidales bacterium]